MPVHRGSLMMNDVAIHVVPDVTVNNELSRSLGAWVRQTVQIVENTPPEGVGPQV